MRKISKSLLLSLIALTSFVGVSAQDPAASERQGGAFIEAISARSRAKVRSFVEANFGGQMQSLPMDQHLNFASSHYDQSRGYEVVSVQDTAPNGVTLL